MADETDRTCGPGSANRNEKGQFGPGNPGKPRGARQKLAESFLSVALKDFEEHGTNAFERVRISDPSTYLKVIAQLLPKEITGEEGGPLQVVIRRLTDGSK